MKTHAFLLEWYYKEDERRYALDNSLNIPIGILTAFVATIYYLVTKYNYEQENSILQIAFWGLIGLSIIFWIISIIFILLSYNDMYKGYTYEYFPCTDFIQKEEVNIRAYYESNKAYFVQNGITFESLLENNVNKIISECLTTNIYNNDKKANYLYWSKIHLINSLIAIFIGGIIFSTNYMRHEKQETYNIKVMNQLRFANQPTPPPPPPPQTPRRVKQGTPPTPPPNPPKK